MLSIKALREYGANVDEAVKRCMNNEAFYLRMVKMAAADKNFEKGAFEAAHALKGVLGNLALTPVLEPAVQLTELLRPLTPLKAEEYEDLLAQIGAGKARLDELIGA